MTIFDKITAAVAKIPGVSYATKYVPLDKVGHFLVGAAAGAVATVISGHPAVGMLTAGIAGVAKEGYDKLVNRRLAAQGLPPAHSVDINDAAATFAGGVVGSIVARVLVLLILG